MQHKVLPPCSPHRVGTRIREGCLFFEKRRPSLTPSQRKFFIASEQLEELQCLPDCTSCVRQSRIYPCYTTWRTPIIRCCAAVGGSAALRMRHTPCGCRSAHLVEVCSNFRLPRHYSMRRASAMPHSVGSLSPDKRHSRLTIVRRGCNRCRIAGIHGEAMYTAPDCAARAVLQD